MYRGKKKKDGEADGYDDIDDSIFDALEEEFENITNTFEEIRKRLIREATNRAGDPFVYGFSMRIGPDGKPNIEEFGNVPGILSGHASVPGEREPLTDVIEGDRDITVVAELPGVEKDAIDIHTTDCSLEIKVASTDRPYHKKLALPAKVLPETARASYKNGVLEVRLERAEQRIGGSYKVKVD